MREVADRERIERFMTALAREATADTDVFLVEGTCAVLVGWRSATIDVDLVMRPESDTMLRAIPMLQELMQLNMELASPDQFIPVEPGWEQRSPIITKIGRVTFRHCDFCAQFARTEPELYRFPAIDPASFRQAVDAVFPP